MVKIENVSIDQICVRKRIREDLGDLATLKSSIRQHGLLNPILVDDRYQLVAGERRLRAAKDLGWTKIDVRVLDAIDPVSRLDMEVHENLLRKNFSEQEIAKSIEAKKRLLHPPWYIRWRNRLLRLKERLFPSRRRAVRPPASHIVERLP